MKNIVFILLIVFSFVAKAQIVKKENLTAAGRGEYAPLLSNDTAEGKAKNRRTEVVLQK